MGLELSENENTMTPNDPITPPNESQPPYRGASHMLHTELAALQDVSDAVDEMGAEIARLRAELKTSNADRDEARRMYCSKVENSARQYGTSAQSIATQLCWDCFKEETP